MTKKAYITTAIPYVNANPILAPASISYLRIFGRGINGKMGERCAFRWVPMSMAIRSHVRLKKLAYLHRLTLIK